ncbi:hypothetical protein ES703_54174 [subsurface metagenome]
MGIKDKQTYGEYYWAMQIEAQKALADDSEKVLAPYIAAILADVELPPETPAGIKQFIDTLSAPPDFTFLPHLIGVGVNAVDEMLDLVFDPILKMLKRYNNRRTKETWLTSSQVNTLWARNKITEGLWDETTASEGYEDALASALYEGELPYPTIPDIVAYSRYHGDADNPWTEFQKWWNISPREWPVWKWLGSQKLTTLQCQTLLKRGAMTPTEFYAEIGYIGWPSFERDKIKDLSYVLPNSMLLVQGGLIQDLDNKTILENISKGDIHPDYAQTYMDAVLTKPASQDVVAYQLRKDPSLSVLETELKKIGIHPKYTDIYKTLAYQIPPVADIITMAVREAFTPEIAVRFGQYEDFPPDLEKYAGQKGLDVEWAKRYWAAHWALPSPQQGFEMLHRGVIDRSELDMLLRASDVMPFWRDKLTQIAYRTLTRVDVRRMYKEGVLSEREVFEAYQDHGYSDENAERMAEFTVKQTLSSLSKFTSSDIIKAFTNRMIDRGAATSMLRDIGIRAEDANYIISTAEYKRVWAFTDDQISGIRNLYKKRIYDEDKARDRLARLNLPAEQIEVLMQQWFYDKVEELDATWTTAQTLKFLKRKLITSDRAKQELYLNGYTQERINIYLRDAQWTPPKE